MSLKDVGTSLCQGSCRQAPPVGPPRAPLARFYFFYFASVGAFLPFWGLYLKKLTFTPSEIGELMAVTLATKIVAPIVWGWIADHTGKRIRIIRFGMLLATLIFSAIMTVHAYWGMMAVLLAFSFFWNAALPQFEATTLDHLGEDAHDYSSIRLWGSAGFIVTVASLGPIFERIDIGWLPVIVLVLLGAIWINTLLVVEHDEQRHHKHASLGGILRQPSVIGLLTACFLLQASHGPYYTFFSIYLEDLGYTRGTIGGLWALGSTAEIGVFLCASGWLLRFGARALLGIAIAVAAVRWFLTAVFADYLLVMLVAQTLHAATFGLYHAAAIHLVHQLFPGRMHGRGQGLYSSLSFGLGGAAGSLMSGYIWSAAGPQWAYVAAALAALAGVLVVWRGVRAPAQ
jgi:PPP family 3-phenylpropionic acid transporter